MFWITFSAELPIGRIVGPEAMEFGGWQRLNAAYAKHFGIETPNLAAEGGSKIVNRGASAHGLSLG